MAFLTAKSLPRRTILRGTGRDAGAAVPRRDASAVLAARAAAAKPVHRFQAFYVPNGMAMEYWTPEGEGADFELSPILEPLAPFRDQMLVLSGLKASWNYIHAGASGSFLTGTPARRTERSRDHRRRVDGPAAGPAFRQARRRWHRSSCRWILPANAGACTGNLSCVYTHTLSWRSPTQPLPMEWNPRAVFEKLFGDSGSTDRDGARSQAAAAQEHSGLGDGEAGDASRSELGPGDQVKVDEYTRCGSRRRAPHSAGRGTKRRRAAGDGAASGRAAGLRRSPGADARLAAARVPVRPDARHLVHDRQGAERAALSADRRAGGAPSAVAP